MNLMLRRRELLKMGGGHGNEIYSLTNYVCDGTVSTVVNSGLRLFDDSIPNWQLDLDATWATSTPTHQQTVIDAKMDANPYQGVIVRWDNTAQHIGNECGFGASVSTIGSGGNTILVNYSYGQYVRVDGSTHFTMTIRKIGVNFYFIYNDTDWWEGTITNYTHSKYLYIGANNNNNVGTAFRRFFRGTINSLKITQLW